MTASRKQHPIVGAPLLCLVALAACTPQPPAAPAPVDPVAPMVTLPAAASPASAPVLAPPAHTAPLLALPPAKEATGTAQEANPWLMAPLPARAVADARVYVLTHGRDRTYRDPGAVYHLYAHDVVASHGELVTIRELGGGSFRVPALFVIAAGVPEQTPLPKGSAVLAEWASSLKHATIIGPADHGFRIRYTDLPETWTEDKVTATKERRQLTLQREGLQAGSFAVANIDGVRYQVLLISESAGRWLVRRFAGRVVALPASDLTPIPLRPKLRRGARVLAPWVGMMYPGVIRSVKDARVTVQIEGIGNKEPIATALGQVLPMPVAPRDH